MVVFGKTINKPLCDILKIKLRLERWLYVRGN